MRINAVWQMIGISTVIGENKQELSKLTDANFFCKNWLEEDLSCRQSKKKHFIYRVSKIFNDLSWRVSTGRCANRRSKKIRKRRESSSGKGKYFIKDYDPMQAVIRSAVLDHVTRIRQMAKAKATAYKTVSKRKTCIISAASALEDETVASCSRFHHLRRRVDGLFRRVDFLRRRCA
ncbi:Oidioi.mRNA.OKI2018_I69.chr1.g2878.t1.cds [Oikopleura dioica]|uniref:Oidioi.mRNA.OKI2018_I69.chr1.g2878.t1.cds n=1 Tax=Oikopleura dioica TaxID=34765 RepID=A0ABN7SSG6_OIKDI|nr:Oidioi.mRNA.OKI2018_I69.chr1.g2878.t1.cds [Oikopleura dioica]